jgi:hypothetical protein
MTGGASAGSPGLWGIVVLRMDPNGPRIGKLIAFAMARKAEGVVVIRLGQLRLTGSSMRIVTIKAQDSGIEMTALLKVEPLLVMGLRMSLGISPATGFKLVIIGQGFSHFVGSIVFVIPGVFKRPVRNADSSRVTLTAYFQTSFVR